jgi:hypothetical protein
MNKFMIFASLIALVTNSLAQETATIQVAVQASRITGDYYNASEKIWEKSLSEIKIKKNRNHGIVCLVDQTNGENSDLSKATCLSDYMLPVQIPAGNYKMVFNGHDGDIWEVRVKVNNCEVVHYPLTSDRIFTRKLEVTTQKCE